ncbi:hypothetical protein AG1IA_09841 [Rhizoctonia solani AG-1 IA]|uniref:Uncharacterized protein n=1 Tax=Thanatephorus cucumeris (strain AG1-IA) TaxID=983506 RepID=L8WIE5_THACA|nr:hypothetical protein AG1IA_09841 [Rhizoctonia solani AG-1 IA]
MHQIEVASDGTSGPAGSVVVNIIKLIHKKLEMVRCLKDLLHTH